MVAWIRSHHLRLQWKFKLWAGKFAWGVKVKQNFENKKFVDITQQYWPHYLKQTFPLIIWIFNEGEGDRIKSRLPFKIFSTLPECDEVELVLVAPPDLTRLLQQQQHNVSSKISPNRMPPAAAPIIIATLDSWVSFLPPGNPTYKKRKKRRIMSH